MNTFFISPFAGELSNQVADEIRALAPQTWISPRGETFLRDDGPEDILSGDGIGVYDADPVPPQVRDPSLTWTYVRAGDWIARFDEKAAREAVSAAVKSAHAHPGGRQATWERIRSRSHPAHIWVGSGPGSDAQDDEEAALWAKARELALAGIKAGHFLRHEAEIWWPDLDLIRLRRSS